MSVIDEEDTLVAISSYFKSFTKLLRLDNAFINIASYW